MLYILNDVYSAVYSGNSFLSHMHADRGRAQDDVGRMGETDLRSSGEKETVN